jgi:hypothetical protein
MWITVANAKKPSMAGYSATPLLKKLGIKETSGLFLINAPDNYFDLLEAAIQSQTATDMREADIFHIFALHKKDLEKHFAAITAVAKKNATIWISWHKKSAKIATDITEDVIRDIVLPTGWVDVKVCAVSDIWSGLKIVKRVENRQTE